MPTVQAIESALFALAPRELAMDWDNVGLLLGDPAAEVTYALLALDVTDAVAAEAKAKGCQLIVSHHPLMNVRWHQREMQTLRPDRRLGRLLTTLIKDDIAVISLHTNLDAAPGGVNDALAAALGLEDPGPLPGDESGICRVGTLKEALAPGRLRRLCGANAPGRERPLVRRASGLESGGRRRRLRGLHPTGPGRGLRYLRDLGLGIPPVPGRRGRGPQPAGRRTLPHGEWGPAGAGSLLTNAISRPAGGAFRRTRRRHPLLEGG